MQPRRGTRDASVQRGVPGLRCGLLWFVVLSALIVGLADEPLTNSTPSLIAAFTAAATRLGATAPARGTETDVPVDVREGGIYWRGDWETGDTGQWAWINTGQTDPINGNTRVEIVTSPVRQGSYAAKFVVDADSDGDPDRAEVSSTQADTGGYEGQEWYYSWSTMFPSIGIDAESNSHPQLYLESESRNQKTCKRIRARKKWFLGPLQYDNWYDFTLHVSWSQDPTVGFVELWVDRTNVVPLTYVQTLDNGGGVYLEQDLYRRDFGATNVLYHDGMRRHDAFSP